MFCNTHALVVIRMVDALDGTDHSALLEAPVAPVDPDIIRPPPQCTLPP